MATLRERTHHGVDKVMDRAEDLKYKALATRERVDGYIKEHPEKSVLLAAGVGAVAGAVLATALMRRRHN